MRILVTGGAGRLGINVCKAFLEDGHTVRVFDLDNVRNRESIKELDNKAELTWGDITKTDSVREALQGVDAVVHMAAILPPVANEKHEMAKIVNVGGTRTIVELIKEKPERIPLIFTSSVAVFGATPDTTIPLSVETHTPDPIEPYGITKLQAENVIRESGIDYAILRLTAVMYFSFEMSDLKRMFSIPLNNRIEFCHPDDLTVAVQNALNEFDDIKGNTLIVSGGPEQRMSYKEMVGSLLRVMGLPLPPARKFTREPYYLDWYDTSKSQKLLKFQRKSFSDYIKDYSHGLTNKYSSCFLPFMRYIISPLLGRFVVKFM